MDQRLFFLMLLAGASCVNVVGVAGEEALWLVAAVALGAGVLHPRRGPDPE
jgi:hypothetical protein